MYTASTAFHNAVANGAPQKALLVFGDAFFTNDDIDVETGIEMDEYFNTEEDVAIGQALSSELRFTLFNDLRLLNDYTFGEFDAYIGARTDTDAIWGRFYAGNVSVTDAGGANTWVGMAQSPYIKVMNNGTQQQISGTMPDFPVVKIICYNSNTYAIGQNGQCVRFTTTTEPSLAYTGENYSLNNHMRAEIAKLAWNGYSFGKNTTVGRAYCLNISKGKKTQSGTDYNKVDLYEFVPLGRFIAKRPNVPDVNQIVFTCHDQMTKFDVDMPSKEALSLTYPTTFSNLFIRMCHYAGVEYVNSVFINGTATITEEPQEFQNATMRQVLQWLAEAAASNLRFDRDGKLTFDWMRDSGLELDEGDYISCDPCWYETTQVSKLYNRNSESGTDKTYGDGDIGYLIQDNPLLKGVE